MKVSLSDQGVPFVITYRKIIKKPKVERHRRFVGTIQFFKNALLKAVEFVDDIAFETETEVKDPGETVAVHWAVSVEDPWDVAPGREANLVAFRMLNDMPPCGAHFEIISPPEPSPDDSHEPEPSSDYSNKVSNNSSRRDDLRVEQQRPGNNEKFARPPAPEYGPRPVRPIIPSLIEEVNEHGDSQSSASAPGLEGTGGVGEDY